MTKSLTGPQLHFVSGVVSGLSSMDAYRAAYPKATPESVHANAFRLMANDGVKTEIARQRHAAELMAGGAILTLAEKRGYFARLVRSRISLLPDDSDLFVSIKRTKDGTEYRLADKLRAIELDNDLAGEGSESEANDALAGLLERCMK